MEGVILNGSERVSDDYILGASLGRVNDLMKLVIKMSWKLDRNLIVSRDLSE